MTFIKKYQAESLGKKYNINFKVVDKYQWWYGLNAEIEHSDITNGDLDLTAKIVISHLKEDPEYYYYLYYIEKKRKEHWKKHKKPTIFRNVE